MALHRTITENPIIKEYKLFSSTHITLIKTQLKNIDLEII